MANTDKAARKDRLNRDLDAILKYLGRRRSRAIGGRVRQVGQILERWRLGIALSSQRFILSIFTVKLNYQLLRRSCVLIHNFGLSNSNDFSKFLTAKPFTGNQSCSTWYLYSSSTRVQISSTCNCT